MKINFTETIHLPDNFNGTLNIEFAVLQLAKKYLGSPFVLIQAPNRGYLTTEQGLKESFSLKPQTNREMTTPRAMAYMCKQVQGSKPIGLLQLYDMYLKNHTSATFSYEPSKGSQLTKEILNK